MKTAVFLQADELACAAVIVVINGLEKYFEVGNRKFDSSSWKSVRSEALFNNTFYPLVVQHPNRLDVMTVNVSRYILWDQSLQTLSASPDCVNICQESSAQSSSSVCGSAARL